MEAGDLIASFRQRADDAAEPYLYSDADLLRFASEAEREACLRARLLWDETTFTIPVLANTALYALDQLIDRIERATFTAASGGRPRDLDLAGADVLAESSEWQSQSGRPECAVQKDRTLRLWPTPGATYAGALTLSVYRFPLSPMESTSDEPEIPLEHHDGLVDWMLFLAYTTKDSETNDPARAARHEALFAARFGERPSADVLRRHRERRRVTTRYGGM